MDLIQAQRFRRLVMGETARIFAGVDAIVGPSIAGNMQLVTNFTGHPSLTLRTGFVEMETRSGINPIGAMGRSREADKGDRHRVPHGITLWGKLFDEGPMLRLGMALEQAMGVWDARPAMATSASASATG